MLKFYKYKFFMCLGSFIVGCTFTMICLHKERDSVNLIVSDVSPIITETGDSKTLKDIFLVIFIFSSIGNVNRRNAIRETWLSDISNSQDVEYYFVISSQSQSEAQKTLITKEQKVYGDLLLFPNLEDSFLQLTSKLLASLTWASHVDLTPVDKGYSTTFKPFGTFQFLLKCDDDSFVRINSVLEYLKFANESGKGKTLYWGFFNGKARVKKGGKYMENNWDICDFYLPYALGGGYVLSQALVQFLAANAKHLKIYMNEDISVGAWLANYASLNRVHDPRFNTEYTSRGCHNAYLITHKHTEDEMRKFQHNIKQTGDICSKEFRTRLSYVYNWSVPPSKCCIRNDASIP